MPWHRRFPNLSFGFQCLLIGFENVIRHRFDTRWTAQHKRCVAIENRWREDEIRQSSGVIRMQVRGKSDLQLLWHDLGGRSAANDSGSEIDDVGGVVDDDGD